MNEFMLLIRNEGDAKAGMSADEHQRFLKACQSYIEGLTTAGKLKSAQPLMREGKMVSGAVGAFKKGPFAEGTEMIVGYYHILAKDLDEAIAIAKANPEFAFGVKARIEVRPIKTREATTAYTYPTKKMAEGG